MAASIKRFILLLFALLAVSVILVALFASWLITTTGSVRKFHLAGVIISGVFVLVFFICLRRAFIMKHKHFLKMAKEWAKDCDVDAEFLASLTGLPTRFSFKDIASATGEFQQRLGRGGFGSVYFGTLPDGSEFAAKRLEKGVHGQKEFCAEVAIISSVRHANLVRMKGFCVEGHERLLVYEYMPRGSLDRWIFRDASQASPVSPQDAPSPDSGYFVLSWAIRYRVAVETARGLAYLHEECEEAILHLDVKPQNILLDENFRAKVSDFGLSRRMEGSESRVLTTVRGTPGYLAPEWFSGSGIDAKTDVYGYGMLVLELLSGRRAVDQSQPDIEDWFLPAMAFRKLKEGKALQVIDPVLLEKMDEPSYQTQALNLIQVALWCIQEDVNKRPSMSTVVQMLEGKIEIPEPPLSRNFLTAKRAEETPPLSITIIDDESVLLPR